jgi:hypothetical protein
VDCNSDPIILLKGWESRPDKTGSRPAFPGSFPEPLLGGVMVLDSNAETQLITKVLLNLSDSLYAAGLKLYFIRMVMEAKERVSRENVNNLQIQKIELTTLAEILKGHFRGKEHERFILEISDLFDRRYHEVDWLNLHFNPKVVPHGVRQIDQSDLNSLQMLEDDCCSLDILLGYYTSVNNYEAIPSDFQDIHRSALHAIELASETIGVWLTSKLPNYLMNKINGYESRKPVLRNFDLVLQTAIKHNQRIASIAFMSEAMEKTGLKERRIKQLLRQAQKGGYFG